MQLRNNIISIQNNHIQSLFNHEKYMLFVTTIFKRTKFNYKYQI